MVALRKFEIITKKIIVGIDLLGFHQSVFLKFRVAIRNDSPIDVFASSRLKICPNYGLV